jgi:hypothetical protein
VQRARVVSCVSCVCEGVLVWDVRQLEAHGVERYPFGRDGWLDLACDERASPEDRPVVRVESSVALQLELRWGRPAHPRVELIAIHPTVVAAAAAAAA